MYKFNREIMWRLKEDKIHDFLAMNVVGESASGVCWLAGGALRGLIDKQDKLVDLDLFFSNLLVATEVGLDLEARGFKVIFKCPKGELTTYQGHDMKVQLITKDFYKDAETMLDTFDIDACRFAYDGKNVYVDRPAIRSVRKREVTLHNVTHPNATFKRMMKYRDKGYKITNEAVDFFTQKVYDMGKQELEFRKQFYVD